MKEFNIIQSIYDGRVYGVLKWLKLVNADALRAQITSTTLHLELVHCSGDDLDMLANGIRHILLDGEIGEINTAPEKESLLFLLFLKAHSIHAGFAKTFRPLDVRAAVIQKRINEHDSETVVGSEEQYCEMSFQLCAQESLHWYEYQTFDYAEPSLISEILDFLLNNDVQARKAQYETILQRALTKKEADLVNGHAAAQTAFSLNWLKDYKAYTEFIRQSPEAGLQTKIDAYITRLQNDNKIPS